MIAVAFGGPSPEHDISILTGLQAARLLQVAGQEVTGLYWAKNGDWHAVAADHEARDFLDGPPASARPLRLVAAPGAGFVEERRLGSARPVETSVVLVACHGGPGENGSLQAALDLAQIPYAGPSQPGAALGMDKAATRAVAAAAGVPVTDQVVLDATSPPPFDPPYVLKPRFGGSSIGIETVDSFDTAVQLARSGRHYADGAVLERYLEGWVDLNIAAASYPEPRRSVIERPQREAGLYSYAEKYLSGGGGTGFESAPRELPASLPPEVEQLLGDSTTRLLRPLAVRGLPRLDFLWDGEGRVVFNEINTIPGALALYLWDASGIARQQVILDHLEEATARPTARWTTAGADGAALRSAADVARKLGLGE